MYIQTYAIFVMQAYISILKLQVLKLYRKCYTFIYQRLRAMLAMTAIPSRETLCTVQVLYKTKCFCSKIQKITIRAIYYLRIIFMRL